MIEGIRKEAEQRMLKSLEALRNEFLRIRTGRAHPSLLEHIQVEYYGNDTPINQVASITVGDQRSLVVTPWEKSMVPMIEKAIRSSDLGLNPTVLGEVLRIPMPELTEERRREMTKLVRNEAEGARVAVRNIRRDANSQLKDLLKAKALSEDDERRAQEAIQKLTDKFVAEVDHCLSVKESDLMG